MVITNKMIITALIKWHKRFQRRFQDKFGISDYGIVWFAFIEGMIIGLIIGLFVYHFFLIKSQRPFFG